MSNPWFRLYNEMPHDDRIEEMAFEDRWHFVNILCMKSSGILDKEYQSEGMRERKIVRELGLDSEVSAFVKTRLMEVGLINSDWNPVAWGKRQFKSDHDSTSAERQRRFREKRVTNALRNEEVTPLDTDTDTDIKPLSTSLTVAEIFNHWKKTFKHPKAVLDDNRKRLINNSLKSGFSVDDLKSAIVGCSVTPHNIGENDRHERFDGLHVIFKNADQIERFMGNSKQPPVDNNGFVDINYS